MTATAATGHTVAARVRGMSRRTAIILGAVGPLVMSPASSSWCSGWGCSPW